MQCLRICSNQDSMIIITWLTLFFRNLIIQLHTLIISVASFDVRLRDIDWSKIWRTHCLPPQSWNALLPSSQLTCYRFSAFWLRSKCLVCCQHIDLWSWMRALFWNFFHCWSVQVFVNCHCTGRWAMFDNTQRKDSGCSAKSCCTATTMALTYITTVDPQSYGDHSAYLLYYSVYTYIRQRVNLARVV